MSADRAGLWLSLARKRLHAVASGVYTAGMKRLPRLTEPLVRDAGGTLRPATWDEALERAAEGIRSSIERHGKDAFGMFCCSKASNEVNYLAMKFARAVVGSNNIDSCNRT